MQEFKSKYNKSILDQIKIMEDAGKRGMKIDKLMKYVTSIAIAQSDHTREWFIVNASEFDKAVQIHGILNQWEPDVAIRILNEVISDIKRSGTTQKKAAKYKLSRKRPE